MWSIAAFSIFLSMVNSLTYDIGGKPELCIKYPLHAGKNLKVTYMFTGKTEKNVEFKVPLL